MATAINRFDIADYIGVGDDGSFALMGIGFNTLDENPSAQTDSKTYINQKAQTTRIKSYQPSFPFDTDLMKGEDAVTELYEIGRNEETGDRAERDYVRVEIFKPVTGKDNVFAARKFRVAVQVDAVAGGGGEQVKVTGTLHSVGDFVDGTFDTTARTFTPAGSANP